MRIIGATLCEYGLHKWELQHSGIYNWYKCARPGCNAEKCSDKRITITKGKE